MGSSFVNNHNTDLNNTIYENTNISQSSFFLFIKNNISKYTFSTVILPLLIPIIIYLIGYYGIPLFKYACPTCFNYLASLYLKFGNSLFIYPVFIWFILAILYHIFRLYVYYWFIVRQRSKDNNKDQKELQNKVILELLPSFLRKRILKIVNEYKESENLLNNVGFNMDLRSDMMLILIGSISAFILFILFM